METMQRLWEGEALMAEQKACEKDRDILKHRYGLTDAHDPKYCK